MTLESATKAEAPGNTRGGHLRLCLYVGITATAVTLGCRQSSNSPEHYHHSPEHYHWLRVRFAAPGFSAAEGETQIANPAEQILRGLPGVQGVRSVSRPEEVVVWLKVAESNCSDDAIRAVADSLTDVAWPDEMFEPELSAVHEGPIMLVALRRLDGESGIDADLRLQATAARLADQLEQVPQASKISRMSGSDPRIEVSIDEDRLKAYGLAVEDVARGIQRENLDIPELRVDREFLIRSRRYSSLEDLSELPILANADGLVVRLRDLADVRLGREKSSEAGGVPWPNGLVLLGVHVESSEAAAACSSAIDQMLASFSLPDEITSVRHFGDEHHDVLTLACRSWPDLLPPNIVLRHTASPKGYSYLEMTPPDFCCVVTGPDFDKLRGIGAQIRSRLSEHRQVEATRISGDATIPLLEIDVDSDKAARWGIPDQTVVQTARTALTGHSVTRVRVEGLTIDVVILTSADGADPEERLSHLAVRSPTGETILLEQICQLTVAQEPAEIWHHEAERCICVLVTASEGTASMREQLESELHSIRDQLERSESECQLHVVTPR